MSYASIMRFGIKNWKNIAIAVAFWWTFTPLLLIDRLHRIGVMK